MTNKHGGGYKKWLAAAPTPTVFNRLEDAGISWRIYFDKLQLVFFAGVLHAPVPQQFWKTERGSVFSHEMHHGALSATLSERCGLEPLTRRDAAARTLAKAFNRKVPRRIADWPQTSPAYVPPNPEGGTHPATAHPDRPLSPPARGLIGLLLENTAPSQSVKTRHKHLLTRTRCSRSTAQVSSVSRDRSSFKAPAQRCAASQRLTIPVSTFIENCDSPR